MTRKISLFTVLLLAGCASAPKLTPWQAEALIPALPAACPGSTSSPTDAPLPLVPGGLSVVRSGGRDVVIVAARSCVMTMDAATGAAEPLPTRGDAIAPTMADATSNGVAFGSSVTGSVRALAVNGTIAFNFSGLRRPLGLQLMPGGAVVVAEHDAGRILQVGPHDDTRPRLLMDKLDGPTGLAVVDATRGYVTETLAGRLTLFRLDRYEKSTVVAGLHGPEGIALMNDGRIAVVETGLRRLIAVDPLTKKIEVLADNLPIGPGSDPALISLATITDLAAAPDGTMFINSPADRAVLKVTLRQPASVQKN